MARVLAVEGQGVDERCRAWGAQAGVHVELRGGDPRAVLEAGGHAGGIDAVVIAPGAEAFASRELAAAVAAAGVPVVAVDPANLRRAGVDPPASPLGRVCARVIYGRGADTARHALGHLARRFTRPFVTVPYGPGPDHVGDLWLPHRPGGAASGPRAPVAVLLHGGFWYHPWERDLTDGLALDLADRGWAAWNLEYRRVGAGGGWPATAQDVAAAIDHLVALAPARGLDAGRAVFIGHSAGGQLALWAAARPDAAVRPRLVVGLAAITDLAAALSGGLGGRSVERLLATAPDPGAALREASPVEQLPLGVPLILAHGADDDHVPVAQTRRYAAAARSAGDAVEVVEFPAGGHFALIDPASGPWQRVAATVGVLAGDGR